MAAIAEVGAKNCKKPETESGKVKLYFGIFFDGTFNHRLQVLLGKRYREKMGLGNELTPAEKEIAKDFRLNDYEYTYNEAKNTYELSVNGEINKLQQDQSNLEEAIKNNPDNILNPYFKKRLNTINEDLKFQLSKYKYDETTYKKYPFQTNDFTNIALLEPFYQPINEPSKDSENKTEYAYRIYVSGSGTIKDIGQTGFESVQGMISGGGLGQGDTGVIQKVNDAIMCIERKLVHITKKEDIELAFHLFGFSRGSTEARVFAHVVKCKTNKCQEHKELQDRAFKGTQKIIKVLSNNSNITIPALGIYDTVSSVGVLFKNSGLNTKVIDIQQEIATVSKLHHRNVDDLGLNDLAMVDDVYHICALDEYRENFALVPIFESTAKKKTEIYIPGCHADVGGGYPKGYDKKISFKLDSLWIPYKAIPYHLRGQQNYYKDGDAFEFNMGKLKETQWFDENKKEPDINESSLIDKAIKKITINRYSEKGYNYIGLRLMIEKYKSLFQFDDNKFKIPDNIQYIYDKVKSLSDGSYYYPDEGQYKALRRDYLHISMDDGMINLPNTISIKTKDNKTIKLLSRIEYTKEYCNKVEKEYEQYCQKRLEQMENHVNQMLI